MSNTMQLSVGVLALTAAYTTTPLFHKDNIAPEIITASVSPDPAPAGVELKKKNIKLETARITAYQDPQAIAQNARAAVANAIVAATEAFAEADTALSAYEHAAAEAKIANDAFGLAKTALTVDPQNAALASVFDKARAASLKADTIMSVALRRANVTANTAAIADSAVIKAEIIAANAQSALKLASVK